MQGRFSRMSLACPTAHLATRGGQKLPTPLPQDSPLTARRETRSSKTMCLAYTLQRKVAQSPTVTSRLCEAIASCRGHACRSICRPAIKNDSSAILRSGKRFVMRADEKLTVFVEVESAIPRLSIGEHNHHDANRQRKESEDGAQDHTRVRPCKTLTGINKSTFGKRIDGARMRTTIK